MKWQKRFYLFDNEHWTDAQRIHSYTSFVCECCAKKIFPIFHPHVERQKTCSSSTFFPLTWYVCAARVAGFIRMICNATTVTNFTWNQSKILSIQSRRLFAFAINWNILIDIFNEKFPVNSAKSTRHRYIWRCIDRYSTLPTGTFWQTIFCSPQSERKTVRMQCRSGKISWRVFDGGLGGVLPVLCVVRNSCIKSYEFLLASDALNRSIQRYVIWILCSGLRFP